MQMISFVFFGFVAIIFVLLRFVNRFIMDDKKAIDVSNAVLLFASYVFIVYADWRFAAVLAGITLTTWYSAHNSNVRKIGIIFAVLALCYFKYTNFFIKSFAKIFGTDYSVVKIILPLGISFYTFSAIGYIIDVSRGKVTARSLMDVALYLSYFPKITSGPIQRSKDFFRQIEKKRIVGWSTFTPGIQIFVFGLFKKIVLADRLSVFVNQVYETPLVFGSGTVFLATLAYSLQIYFDFSGYSDMAIGVSRIIGVNLPRNFNLPYLSYNVTEFWKRWHITLSSWLQEYVYISLGGNRKGKYITYSNLLLTMLIGGLWHGANWTYIFWGLLHGIALVFHKIWMKLSKSHTTKHSALVNVVAVLLTFLYTNFCWIFFRAETIEKAFTIIKRMVCLKAGVSQPYMWLFISMIILVLSSIVAYTNSNDNTETKKAKNTSFVEGYYPFVNLESFWGLVIFFVFCGIILIWAYTGGSPFIYGNY